VPALPPPRVQIGIDENGLGPRLGPMIVTAVRVEIDPAKIATRRAYLSAATRAGIGDSKEQSAHGAMGPCEARVLAMLKVHLGLTSPSLTHLAETVGLEEPSALRSDCPPGEAPHACFRDAVDLPAFGDGPQRDDHAAAEKLLAKGIRLVGARVGIVCAKRMNVARDAGLSRFDLDLAYMVRLAESLRGDRGAGTVTAYCGKVGGRARYSAALERLSPLVGVLEEERARSSYAVPGFGEVHFVMDGDATEPAIGLASMLGKYVRELWMMRIHRYWAHHVDGLEEVSGYHDPSTEQFVQKTALVRRERGIPEICFER
jgi:ribonuclease HII